MGREGGDPLIVESLTEEADGHAMGVGIETRDNVPCFPAATASCSVDGSIHT